MKISVCSDIHLEFGPIILENKDNADVLILSGDICVAADLRAPDMYGINDSKKMINTFKFFESACANFPKVIYVAGNHEHYHGDFKYTYEKLREQLKFDNLHILDKQSIHIGDVVFVGGTLWTNMNKEDPVTMANIRGVMNDYRQVINSNNIVKLKHPVYGTKEGGGTDFDNIISYTNQERPASLMPEDTVEDHKAFLKVIDEVTALNPNYKYVVVGHHAPSKLSTKPRYENEYIMNGAYSSDLSEFILDRPQIKLWTHGHTHNPFDYMIGSTRIFCNPRGYDGYEDRADKFELMTVEV